MSETEIEARCASCQGVWSAPYEPPPWPYACPSCQNKYPPALLKATMDEFDYALGLRDGKIVRFASAKIHNDWVTLYGQTEHDENPIDTAVFGFPCPRGIDVRVSEIIWVADAPEGS